jgi:hypothetical protein
VSQNSRIPNLERGREGPSGARKKIALPEEDINTLILFNTNIKMFKKNCCHFEKNIKVANICSKVPD